MSDYSSNPVNNDIEKTPEEERAELEYLRRYHNNGNR